MSENYTDGARAAIQLAERVAARSTGGPVDTEHVLLGVLSADGSVAEAVLTALGVDLTSMRRAVESIIEPDERPTPGSIEYSNQATDALRHAKAEADESDQFLIGTDHLLLGLLRE